VKKEFEDFLFNFTTDDDLDGSPRELSDREAELLNPLLTNVSEQDLLDYISTIGERFFNGFFFFNSCFDKIDLTNKEKFLQFTWIMFADQADDTKTEGYHAWMGQFDPLCGEEADHKYAKWFREGIIRFEFEKYEEQHILVPLEYTFQYLWWKNIEHFLDELCEFQTKDFILIFLKQLGKKLDKDKQLSMPSEMNNFQISEAFQTWAGDDLKQFDEEEMDWHNCE